MTAAQERAPFAIGALASAPRRSAVASAPIGRAPDDRHPRRDPPARQSKSSRSRRMEIGKVHNPTQGWTEPNLTFQNSHRQAGSSWKRVRDSRDGASRACIPLTVGIGTARQESAHKRLLRKAYPIRSLASRRARRSSPPRAAETRSSKATTTRSSAAHTSPTSTPTAATPATRLGSPPLRVPLPSSAPASAAAIHLHRSNGDESDPGPSRFRPAPRSECGQRQRRRPPVIVSIGRLQALYELSPRLYMRSPRPQLKADGGVRL